MTPDRSWLSTAFHLLYHQLAWAYDLVSALVSVGQWRAWQRAALPFLIGPHVLELAHGPGHMLKDLTDLKFQATGLELSPQMGRLAQHNIRSSNASIRLVRARAQALPFADKFADSILATFPTAYIYAPETIAAAYRVLKPGGRMVIVPEAQLTGQDPLSHFLEWLYKITGQRHAEAMSIATGNEFWQKSLSGLGFQVEVRRIVLPRSVVTIVIAHRPDDH